MLTLIQGASLYTPTYQGTKDVLLAGSKVIDIQSNIELETSTSVKKINAREYILAPGFVDSLVHITGGGGEAGFASRTPEMNLTDATLSGITTVIGALGTDSSSRTLSNLIAKAKGLKEQGLNVFCHTGSYHLPAKTLTGSITDDLMYVEEFVGVGEVAISDHRSSQPTVQQLAQLAAEAKVAGMLSGKSGIVSVHVGPQKSHLTLLHEVASNTDIKLCAFYPTHMNRNKALLDAGVKFCNAGGTIDFTASTTQYDLEHGEYSAAQALAYCINQGVSPTQLTISSDGHASLPIFDQQLNLVGLEIGKEDSLHHAFVQAVQQFSVSIEHALMAITNNPAKILGIDKGYIATNCDADLVLLDKKTLIPSYVWSNGILMVEQSTPLVKGMFE
ncbi:beta-aspartyl-peptidase [Pseudoalteromonas sp. S16_S37]|uniref:beta-aspartyl-peptidase n=1 Tax=Pseudoalteromonas sp. S16_S37 TaxID=2720228 RepID=UPI0016800875|nr:beta-aspartyl-peptidase [Pseudoalteromonas sp. S16_S37]MBD1584620.1 beta-aspartyl-peptidase [Pseudoalteromonas sp. S16_S37]